MVYAVSSYVLGALVFPFVFSFVEGWPFAKPRLDGEDTFFVALGCVFWPVVAAFWLLCCWWCCMSWLGTKARKFADARWADIRGWAHEQP